MRAKFLWALGIFLLLALAVPFFLKNRHGRPLLTPADVHAPKVALPDLPELPDLPWGDREDAPITVFKWQDEAGAWHFSDHPPEGVKAEAVEVRPRMVTPDPPPAAEAEDGEKAGKSVLPFRGMVDRTHDAAQSIEARGEALREDLEGLDTP